ncbi:TetR/AcrR family transcriptional regulator [Nocardia neocaledoniensis]|uniref:TetR/AcrR family transcriptional regulator n=1 Tax=Nocardia neocaledoniensis TaxID=236511 RepID=UPI002458CF17|nr:TetR/AcrR family transcriptional regulator [Nocardia neocaledoniensis]
MRLVDVDCPIAARLPRQPRQKRSKARVEQVLDQAHAIIGDRGLAGLTMQQLATDLGWPRPTIYKHFPSIESVVHGLAERHADRLDEQLRDRTPEDLPTIIRIVARSYEDPIEAAVLLGTTGGAEDPLMRLLAERIAAAGAPTGQDQGFAQMTAAALRGCLISAVTASGRVDERHLEQIEAIAQRLTATGRRS